MKRKIFSPILILLSVYFYTFLLNSATIDIKVNEILSPISIKVASIVFYSVNIGQFNFPLILAWLIAASLFCTFYFGFINICC